MSTVLFARTPTLVAMTDDSMEISSEQGHNDENEDIDIDIDLMAGQNDEDYVLEDVASHIESEEDTTQHAFINSVGVDAMVDDAASFTMNDAESIHEEMTEGNEAHHDHALSFIVEDVQDDPVQEEHSVFSIPDQADASATEAGFMWDGAEDEPDAITDTYENLQAVTEQSLDGTLASEDNPQVEEDASSVNRETGLSDEEPSGPPNSRDQLQGLSTSNPLPHGIEDSRLDTSNALLEAETARSEDKPAGDHENSSSDHEIMVLYQDTEYRLFPKSASDPPDSFFLSDRSILDEPVSVLLAALRDVIHEELADDDELCLRVVDLELELDETSKQMQEVTFRSLIELYQRLLRNDGSDSSKVLSLMLGTRPNFLSRLGLLTRGADEGKGLRDVTKWDDESESFEEYAEVAEPEATEQATEEVAVEAPDTNGVLPEAQERSVVEESQFPQNEGNDSGGRGVGSYEDESHEVDGQGVVDHKDDNDDDGIDIELSTESAGTEQHESTENRQEQVAASQTAPRNGGGELDAPNTTSLEYDADDLIDYSEEESEMPLKQHQASSPHHRRDEEESQNGTSTDLFTPCLKPHVCFCSNCGDVLLADYEALNQEYERRSMSRTANTADVVDTEHVSETADEHHIQQDPAENHGIHDGDGHYEGSAQAYDRTNGQAAYIDSGHESHIVEKASSEHEANSNGDGGMPKDIDQLQEFHSKYGIDEEDAPDAGNGHSNFEDEIDFGEDDGLPDEQDSDRANEESALNSDSTLPRESNAPQSLADHLDLGDIADNRSAGSERTLTAQADVDEDEIGYEDDEDVVEEASDRQDFAHDTEASASIQNTSTKRPRSDANLDEESGTHDKESKRPKSSS